MLNILITGIGGQGTVLAAKMIAQAARGKGRKVRTAETIGMAQRGGSVISHVCIGDNDEDVYAPLIKRGSANVIIAFEPTEAVRVLEYLAPEGLLVCASSVIVPVAATLSDETYAVHQVTDYLARSVERFLLIDDKELCEKAGSKKVLNTLLLASALGVAGIEIGVDDLKQAVRVCVKEKFIPLNLAAIDVACAALSDERPRNTSSR